MKRSSNFEQPKQSEMNPSISNGEKARLRNILDVVQRRQCSPSEVLELIRKHASHWISDNDLKEMWMLGLPQNIVCLLPALPVEIKADLNQFVAAADDIFFELEKPAIKVKKTVANTSSDVFEANPTNEVAMVLKLEKTLRRFNSGKKKLPSKVLRHLCKLTCSERLDDAMKEIWLRSLPEEVVNEIIQLPAEIQDDLKKLCGSSDAIFQKAESAARKRLRCQMATKCMKNDPNEQLVRQKSDLPSNEVEKSTEIQAELTVKDKKQPQILKSPQTSNECSNRTVLMEYYSNSDPEVVELKELLKAYNSNFEKRPLDLLTYLKRIIINKTCTWTNRSFSPLPDNVIKDICVSSLHPEILNRIQALPSRKLVNWDTFQHVATRFFKNQADLSKSQPESKKTKPENKRKKGRGTEYIVQSTLNSFDGLYSLALETYEHKKERPQNTPRELKNTIKADAPRKKVRIHKKNERIRLDDLLGDFKRTGDKKPSELLKFLRQDTGTEFKDDTLQLIWLSHLPDEIKLFLTTESALTLDELAINADGIYDQTAASKTAIKSESTTADLLRKMKMLIRTVEVLSDRLEALNVNVHDITSEINELTSSNQSCCAPKKQTADLYRGNGRKKYRKEPRICYFHRLHGSVSEKCEPPCLFMTIVSKLKWRRGWTKMARQTPKYPFTIEYKKQIAQFIETAQNMDGI